ncbi:MAG: outer membrane protein [Woeseia sp.]
MRIIFGIAALFIVPVAAAQEKTYRFAWTPFAGYAFGGAFDDVNGIDSLDLEDDANLGLILDIRDTANTQWEILYSRQVTAADTTSLPVSSSSFDVDVHYVQAGGTYQGGGDHARPYLAATIGATHFDPGLSGSDSETFFSFSIGLGLQFRPDDGLGFRLEARAFGTVLESNSNIFCETGPAANICAITTEGSVLWQLATFAGLVIRF